MPEKSRKFHEFALRSILFKGRNDWYFCYLKTERIAHVLALLASRSPTPTLKDMAAQASVLPGDIARLAAGEHDAAAVLAEVFALLTAVRLGGTTGHFSSENALLLGREYEQVAERLVSGSHPSPIDISTFRNFDTPELPLPDPSPFSTTRSIEKPRIKDKDKGQNKGQTNRSSLILAAIRKQQAASGHGASIKDIAAMVPGCSEKTVQRELNALIEQGVIRRMGERRWSVYILAEEG